LQLWLIPKAAEAKPVPSLTLRPSGDGNFDLLVANPPDAIGALAITDQPGRESAAYQHADCMAAVAIKYRTEWEFGRRKFKAPVAADGGR
jgi:hypothetical protein